MSARLWNYGPPPHAGWWNASATLSDDMWRWWNGKSWSEAAWEDMDAKYAGVMAGFIEGQLQRYIQWSTYYPKNARVPRIAP